MIQSLYSWRLKKQTSFNKVLYVFPTVEERYYGDSINYNFQEVKMQFNRKGERRSVWKIMLRSQVYRDAYKYRDIRSVCL